MPHDWTLSTEGISPGWALLGFLVLAAAAIFAYRRFAPDVPFWRRLILSALRVGIIAIFGLLLIKPVLNLTLHEPVRQTLPVLLDVSQSMTVRDRRDRPDDVKRAAIATGLLPANKGLGPDVPARAADELRNISRWELLHKLAANDKLDLWHRLQADSNIALYTFGREANAATLPSANGVPTVTTGTMGPFFKSLLPDKPATAIGDSLRQAIQENRDLPVGGIVLITDGQNNSGTPSVEAAQMARDRNIPLFIYGIGVTAAPDLILEEIHAQKLAFAKERVEVRAKFRLQGMTNKTVAATLKVNGVEEDQQTLAVSEEGEYELPLHFTPQEAGENKLEVTLAPLPEETVKDNNSAAATLRVTDSKFHVLLIEQEPRWDFRYLLAYLQRDRRLDVHCVMINGEPDLSEDKDSPFLPGLPDDRDEFFNSQVLILGDVNPDDLGDERMHIIRDWVEAGGGIIFLAGPNFNPSAYIGTPLEGLLPVVPTVASAEDALTAKEPFKLQLTPLGESSPYLQMSPDPDENRRIWDAFPGVHWTASVLRLKPGAESLLVDPRAEKSGRYGAPPVFATQGYGAGTCVYLGINETYRWRSQIGEKYYSILWGQIMQSLALQLLEGGSPHTQLRTDRPQYGVGDKVTIAGKAFMENFKPLLTPALEGTVTYTGTGSDGKISTQKETLTLAADADAQGYRGQFVAKAPGEYSFSTQRDPDAVVKFEVAEPRLEHAQTALNERPLKAMAEITGGKFLREEDLNQLPQFVRAKTATVESFKRIELYYSPWCLVALLILAFAEWLLRRLTQLK